MPVEAIFARIEADKMRLYELALVLRTKLSDKDRKKVVGTVKNWVKDMKVLKEDELGQKPLAYPIKKETAGYYLTLHLEGEKISADLERRLLQTDEVLRHLLIRTK